MTELDGLYLIETALLLENTPRLTDGCWQYVRLGDGLAKHIARSLREIEGRHEGKEVDGRSGAGRDGGSGNPRLAETAADELLMLVDKPALKAFHE